MWREVLRVSGDDGAKKISTRVMLIINGLMCSFEKKAKKSLQVKEKVVFLQPQKSKKRDD